MLLVLLLAAAFAQDDDDAYVVTAPVEHPPSADLDAADLEAAGVDDLAGAVDLLTGVSVRVGGQGAARADLRGARQRSACVVLDGVLLYDPWSGALDLSRIPTTAVSSVTLEHGPSPDLPGCPAGVIRVALVDPSSVHRAGRMEVGTGWHGAGRAAISTPLGNDGGIVWGMAADHRESWRLPRSFPPLGAEDGGARELSWRSSASALANGSVAWPSGLAIRGGYVGSVSAWGVPPDTSASPRFRRYRPVTWHQVGVRAAAAPGPALLTGAVWGAWYHQKLTQFSDDTLDLVEREERDTAMGGGVSGSAAVDVREGVRVQMAAATRAGLARTVAEAGDAREAATSVGGETTGSVSIEVEPTDWLAGSASTGLHGWTGGLTPVGSAQLETTGTVGVRLALLRGARAPTLRELADPERAGEGLDSEVMEQTELAVQGDHGALRWDLTVWRQRTLGRIAAWDTGAGDRVYANLPTERVIGAEAGLAARPLPAVRVRAVWSVTHLVEGLLLNAPAHHGRVVGSWTGPRGTTVDVDLAVVGRRASGSVTLDPYALVDLQLTQDLGPVWLRLRVDNLTDTLYEERALEPREGRSVLLMLGM